MEKLLLEKEIEDIVCACGPALIPQTIVFLLRGLIHRFGNEVTLKGTYAALDDLKDAIETCKKSLYEKELK